MKAISLDELVAELNRVHAGNVLSVVLYGSAVTHDHIPGVSDQNVLVILGSIKPEDLRAAHPLAERWNKAGNPLPVYFTREEISDAADVFPIEFLDMSERHRVLSGIDIFQGLTISKANLRHQLEYELRGKLIRLRELYIPASHSGERLSRLMMDSLPNFTTLFRHALGLAGSAGSHVKRGIIDQVGARLGVDVSAFLRVLGLREHAKLLPLSEAESIFAGYLTGIQLVIEKVDELDLERV
ncbi:MAG: hypothetical protein HY650_06095 [Acidobacteria bacterium]|nr:hypothetical protein [Acidobacteriota bacterium]